MTTLTDEEFSVAVKATTAKLKAQRPEWQMDDEGWLELVVAVLSLDEAIEEAETPEEAMIYAAIKGVVWDETDADSAWDYAGNAWGYVHGLMDGFWPADDEIRSDEIRKSQKILHRVKLLQCRCEGSA